MDLLIFKKGKTLSAKEEESVTAAVFKEVEPPNAEDEAAVIPPSYVYVPDLIKEPRMTYFRLPKLGSFIAFPLKFKSYLKVNRDNIIFQKRSKQALIMLINWVLLLKIIGRVL